MKKFASISAVACAAMLAVSLTGCSAGSFGAPNEQQQAQAANRAYMSSVNQCMDSLNEGLDSFEQAVSSQDFVSLKAKLAKASEAVAQLEEIKAPDALADVHQDYVDGCKSLNEALSAYVACYEDLKNGKDASYAEKLKAIQGKYEEGIAKIKEADDLAAAKGKGESTQSDSSSSDQKS